MAGKRKTRTPPSRGADSRRSYRFHLFPSPPRRAALKELISDRSVGGGGLTALAPTRAVLDDPLRQRPLKADVVTGLFRLNPLVLKDFLTLRLKFPVQRGTL